MQIILNIRTDDIFIYQENDEADNLMAVCKPYWGSNREIYTVLKRGRDNNLSIELSVHMDCYIEMLKGGAEMVIQYVFDACVPIGLAKIGYLEQTLNSLEKLDATVSINIENFGEIKKPEGTQAAFRAHNIVEIFSDNAEFRDFRVEIGDKNINLSKVDGKVLYTAVKKSADYIVSVDPNVLDKAKKYQRSYGVSHMTPLSTPTLLSRLILENAIDVDVTFKKIMDLFKFDEIGNIAKNLDEGVAREKFQLYKDPLFELCDIYYTSEVE